MLARNNTNPAQWLSRRELECCKLACLGYSNKQIADLLSRSIKTIEKHKQACFEKLEAHTVLELLRRAFELEVLTFDEWRQNPPSRPYCHRPLSCSALSHPCSGLKASINPAGT
jgi:DNA-binding CsgD family transcriptional regulator